MGRSAGLSLTQIVEAAAALADRDGLDELSLASVAARLDVKSPSLYNHVDGLAGLRRQLALHASAALTDEVTDATEGREGPAALRAVADRFRSFALCHPGLYASLLPAPAPDDDPELAAALHEPVAVISSILAAMRVEASEVIPLIRALRAAVHGFVDLELRGGFGLPNDVDVSFATTVGLVVDAIAARAEDAGDNRR